MSVRVLYQPWPDGLSPTGTDGRCLCINLDDRVICSWPGRAVDLPRVVKVAHRAHINAMNL